MKKRVDETQKSNQKKKELVVVQLPTDADEMALYVKNNRTTINEVLVNSFDRAVREKFPKVEVFSFTGTNYVIMVHRKDFRENLQNILEYSLETEEFEICAKAKSVIDKIDKFSFAMNYEKPKKQHVKTKKTKKSKAKRNRGSNHKAD